MQRRTRTFLSGAASSESSSADGKAASAPAAAAEQPYDDFGGFDVRGKVLLVLRAEPRAADPNAKFGGKEPSSRSLFVSKANRAAEKGAKALIFVNPPHRDADGDGTIDAAKAGAAIVHCHVRDPETGKPRRDVHLYREVTERIRDANVDVVLNLTAGMGGDLVLGGADGTVFVLSSPTAVAHRDKKFTRVDSLVVQGNTAVILDRDQTSVTAVGTDGQTQQALRAGEGATTMATDTDGWVLVTDDESKWLEAQRVLGRPVERVAGADAHRRPAVCRGRDVRAG